MTAIIGIAMIGAGIAILLLVLLVALFFFMDNEPF